MLAAVFETTRDAARHFRFIRLTGYRIYFILNLAFGFRRE